MSKPSLSKKNLDRVAEFCDKNPGLPLSKAYDDACVSIGWANDEQVAAVIAHAYSSADVLKRRLDELSLSAFAHRDLIGRLILEVMSKTNDGRFGY